MAHIKPGFTFGDKIFDMISFEHAFIALKMINAHIYISKQDSSLQIFGLSAKEWDRLKRFGGHIMVPKHWNNYRAIISNGVTHAYFKKDVFDIIFTERIE